MKDTIRQVSQITAFLLMLCSAGCGGSHNSSALSAQESQELEKLRTENQEVRKLRVENQELERLRRDNQELPRLRGNEQEISKLRAENEGLRAKLAAAPTPSAPALATTTTSEPEAPQALQPIQNLPQAFEEAAMILASQGNPREEDTPQKGDNLLIDQSVIGLLIPDFAKNTNGGPYEVSGWLASRGVNIKNYQQLNLLGITNYQVRRAPPSAGDANTK